MSELYYISASQAEKELQNRRALRAEVEAFWEENGIPFPEVLKQDGKFACLGRHVATFRFEDAVFTLMAQSADLEPMWLTYTGDKFVTCSNVKRSLTRPAMTQRLNRNGDPITVTNKLVPNIDQWSGKPLSMIHTRSGESLVDWHGRRLIEAVPNAVVHDMTPICRDWGGRADRYYRAYLSLFVAHAVLFEDYHGGESGDQLDGFTANVFEPNADQLEDRFGVKPMVTPLPWWPELSHYPDGEWLTNWRSCKTILRKEAA